MKLGRDKKALLGLVPLVSALAALLVVGGQAKAAVIDFEGKTDGTVITNQYTGFTFTNAVIRTAGISLNQYQFPPHSGNNVASDNNGPMTITFGPAVQSFFGFFTYSEPVTITAFDSAHNQVAAASSRFSNNEALSGDEGSGPNEVISVSASAIASITITCDPAGNSFALDDMSINGGSPNINPGGVVPLNSISTTIQPGTWNSIYGTNLAAAFTQWKGDFPTNLGGTTVTINGKLAYLYFVSPGQIGFQAPSDTATGTVPVVVTTPNGTANATVTLGTVAPSFSLLGDAKNHVAGIILRTNGSGTQGGGTYDIIGPTGSSLGFATVAAKAGDIIELYGVGFGPTTPSFPAGAALAAGAYGTTVNAVQLLIGGKTVQPSFAGITEAGLYQLNVTVPSGLGAGDVSIQAMVAGVQTPTGFVISLQ